MNFEQDYFALFNLPRRFAIDTEALDARYRELQAQYHPDKFANASTSELRLAMQRATRLNEAYQTLKKPLTRAQYLLRVKGCGDEGNLLTNEFLEEQMSWREKVASARADEKLEALEAMYDQITERLGHEYEALGCLLCDEATNPCQHSSRVQELMFLEKLRADIDEAIAQL